MIKQLDYVYKTEGIDGILHRISRTLGRGEVNGFDKIKKIFEGKNGLEIGGPSSIFKKGGIFPIYPLLGSLDGCNFSTSTVWEGQIIEGETYNYGEGKMGRQFIADAIDLRDIPGNKYDFVLSCHSLEHIANPVKALKEWIRVLKNDGYLTIVLPDPKYTFDHKRPVTTLNHLIKDYNDNTVESDLTHAEEIISLHDLSRDPFSKNKDVLPREWVLENYEHRCLHHHVFSAGLIKELLTYLGLEVIKASAEKPFHIVAIGKKIGNV